MQHAYEPNMLGQAWNLLQIIAVAGLAGWAAERVLDTDVRTRGLPFLSGLFGLYVGPRLVEMAGWPAALGPEVAGQPVLAGFAGALLIAAFLKLASLGAARPRW